MRSVAICILLLVATSGAAVASDPVCAPAKLVHVTWRFVGPDIQPGSFDAMPRDQYRIGSDKSRVEEALDSQNHLQELMVTAEPDAWLINLYDHTGKHTVDPGPTFFSRDPVLGVEGLSQKLIHLEFGCEAEYLAANAPKPDRTEEVDGLRFDVFRIVDGEQAIELLERPGSGIPAYARLYEGGKMTVAIHYDKYETGLTNDPKLFAPPPGISLEEVK